MSYRYPIARCEQHQVSRSNKNRARVWNLSISLHSFLSGWSEILGAGAVSVQTAADFSGLRFGF